MTTEEKLQELENAKIHGNHAQDSSQIKALDELTQDPSATTGQKARAVRKLHKIYGLADPEGTDAEIVEKFQEDTKETRS